MNYTYSTMSKMSKKERIAVLMHEGTENRPENYLIYIMANYWREDGHKVFFLYGTKRFVPADILFVHVDLSVVPDFYLSFAARYPIVVNGGVKDIRKKTFSPGLLKPGDSWDGPVIVKTNKNYAGKPESKQDRCDGIAGYIRRKMRAARNRVDLEWLDPAIKKPTDYPVYDHLREVPRLYFYHPELVIQKFMPEIENGLYCLRNMHFLGDHVSCLRLKSRQQIVNMATSEDTEWNIEPEPELVALRDQLGFDYGKFDYVMIDGQAVLLDINKTIGWPGGEFVKSNNGEIMTYFKCHSEGMYHFFREQSVHEM
jgi:hypothetical protein